MKILDGNGKITRYILPAPPLTPNIKVVPGNQDVAIYWDKRTENSVDPISGKKILKAIEFIEHKPGLI